MTVVRYIKPAIGIPVGTVTNMQNQYARALRAIGIVEYFDPSKEAQRTIDPIEHELVSFAKEFKSVEVEKVQPVKAEEEKPKRGRPAKK